LQSENVSEFLLGRDAEESIDRGFLFFLSGSLMVALAPQKLHETRSEKIVHGNGVGTAKKGVLSATGSSH
jgi:hypothetical protein